MNSIVVELNNTLEYDMRELQDQEEDDVKGLKHDIKKLAEELNELKDDHKDDVDKHQNENCKLRSTLEDIQDKLKDLKNDQ